MFRFQKKLSDITKYVFPGLVSEKATFLGKGIEAIVLDNHDPSPKHPLGTVTKILLRDRFFDYREMETLLDNQIWVLRLLAGRKLHDIQVPELVTEPVRARGSETYFAAYRMTKVPGASSIYFSDNQASPALKAKAFREVGRAMAIFHAAIAGLPVQDIGMHGPSYSEHIEPVERLGDETNRALEIADRYLQTHKKAANIHGDFCPRKNVLADARGLVTGLVDFAWTAHSGNHLSDFLLTPPDHLPDVIEGYEKESGEPVDPLMMKMTQIARCTAAIDNEYSCARNVRGKMLARHLYDISSVTGFVPRLAN